MREIKPGDMYDREFFKLHPDRRYNLRRPFAGEFLWNMTGPHAMKHPLAFVLVRLELGDHVVSRIPLGADVFDGSETWTDTDEHLETFWNSIERNYRKPVTATMHV